MPRVLPGNAVTLKRVNRKLLDQNADLRSMNVICPNFATGLQSFVRQMFSKWMVCRVKSGRHFATKERVGHTVTNAGCCGGHLVKNQIINAMNRTKKAADMAIAATIV